MKTSLSWVLVGLLALGSTGCIYVHVKGDLENDFWDGDDTDDGGFDDLSHAVEGCLSDPKYELQLADTLWKKESTWTVAFAESGSDPESAFHRVQDAVRQRVEARGGHVTGETNSEISASSTEAGATRSSEHVHWACKFHLDGEPGEASVELEDRKGDEAHPRQLVLRWKESD